MFITKYNYLKLRLLAKHSLLYVFIVYNKNMIPIVILRYNTEIDINVL